MSVYHLKGEPPVEVRLRRSARAKRLSLRVSQLDGRVTLTLPAFVSEREACGFIEEKAGWLRGHVAKFEVDVPVRLGTDVPFCGEMIRIVAGEGRRVVFDGAVLQVSGNEAQAGAKAGAFMKERARAALSAASDRYAAKLGLPFSRITLRDTRSRWGSCSSAGALMYSWRLIMAPPEVLEYVAAHEVAHLKEMNHSRAFWDVVENLYGPHAAPRRWLKEKGTALHKYRFAN